MLDAVKKYAGVDFNEIHSDEAVSYTHLDGKSTKIIIPSEIQNMAGLLTSAKELLSDK